MQISRGLVVSLILMALAAGGYWQFQNELVNLSRRGTPASQRPSRPGEQNDLTEEAWTIMEVCDQIVFLLRLELMKKPMTGNRITAERNRSEPVSYSVAASGLAKSTITLTSSVWDPATYQGWCQALSSEGAGPGASGRPNILTELLMPDTASFLVLEERLSAELAKHARNPEIYTDAALLLGTMAWFDAGGRFQDVRPLLNRMTAFLAVADALGAAGKSREIAEMLRFVLTHDQAGALQKITAARTSASGLPQPWLDALEVTATGDWRKTEPKAASGPVLLQLAHFRVLARNMGANKAEFFLGTLTKPGGVSWVRYLTQGKLGIRQGHSYSRSLLGLEAADANAVARSFGQGAVNPGEAYAGFVTTFDGRTAYERPPEARIVGLQLWAGRTQRHFLQAIQTALVEGRPKNVEAKRMECHAQFAATHELAMEWESHAALGNRRSTSGSNCARRSGILTRTSSSRVTSKAAGRFPTPGSICSSPAARSMPSISPTLAASS